jgi:hypothetical protein
VAGSNPSASVRQRAYALAASGDYLLWPNIAQVLASEGFSAAAIKQVGKDRAAQHEISALIHASAKTPPDETRFTRWRRLG